MGNNMFGNENKISLYSNQTSWLKEITGSKKKYEEYVKNHKVTTYTGTRMEPQIYHFSDLRYQDLKDTKTLYVHVKNPEDVQTISDALMNYPVNINPQENHEEAETQELPYPIKQALPFLLIVQLMFFVILLLEASFEEKKVSIWRLLGGKLNHILVRRYVKDIVVYIVCGIALGIISCFYLYITWKPSYYFLSLLIIYGCQLLSISLFYLILYLVEKRQAILDGISNNIRNRAIFFVDFVVKIVLVLLASTALSTGYQQLTLFINEYQMADNLKEMAKNKIQLDGMDGNKLEADEKVITELFYHTQEVMEDSDALYIDASSLAYDVDKSMQDDGFYDMTMKFTNAVRVNPAFMEKFPILDENGKRLDFTKRNVTENPVVCIPVNLWDDDAIAKLKQDSMYRSFEYIKIQEGQQIFAFDAKVGIHTHGFVEDAVLVLDGNYNMNYFLVDIGDMPGKTQADKFDAWQTKNGIEPVYFYKSPQEMIDIVIRDLRGKVLKYTLQLLLLLVSIVVLSYQFIYMYIKKYRKKIFVYKMLGASVFHRYESLFVSFVLCYAFVTGILFFQGKGGITLFEICIMAVDILITMLMIWQIEKKAIASELKGDS